MYYSSKHTCSACLILGLKLRGAGRSGLTMAIGKTIGRTIGSTTIEQAALVLAKCQAKNMMHQH